MIELLITVILFFATIVTSSLAAVGFYAACGFDGDENFDLQTKEVKKQWPKPDEHQGMILWWIRYYGGQIMPHTWTKPLYSCLVCMGSIHSIAPTILFCHLTGTPGWIWMLTALVSAGVNKLITIWWSK